jgi:hypothetical protein
VPASTLPVLNSFGDIKTPGILKIPGVYNLCFSSHCDNEVLEKVFNDLIIPTLMDFRKCSIAASQLLSMTRSSFLKRDQRLIIFHTAAVKAALDDPLPQVGQLALIILVQYAVEELIENIRTNIISLNANLRLGIHGEEPAG